MVPPLNGGAVFQGVFELDIQIVSGGPVAAALQQAVHDLLLPVPQSALMVGQHILNGGFFRQGQGGIAVCALDGNQGYGLNGVRLRYMADHMEHVRGDAQHAQPARHQNAPQSSTP